MQNLVTDTNFWYDANAGEQFAIQFQDFNICPTWLNLIELISTEITSLERYRAVLGASRKLLLHIHNLVDLHPLQLICERTGLLYEQQPQAFYLANTFKQWLANFETLRLSEVMKRSSAYYAARKDFLIDILLEDQKTVQQVQTGQVIPQPSFVEYDTLFECKKLWSLEIDIGQIKILGQDESFWSDFQFYIQVRRTYFDRFNRGIKKVIDINDVFDIYNTIYVRNGDVYYSRDKILKHIDSKVQNIVLPQIAK